LIESERSNLWMVKHLRLIHRKVARGSKKVIEQEASCPIMICESIQQSYQDP